MSESEQVDDPAAIQQWIDDLRSIPPVPSPDSNEEAAWQAWEETMSRHNVDAVREQFEEG
jgi:hypothetical protein